MTNRRSSLSLVERLEKLERRIDGTTGNLEESEELVKLKDSDRLSYKPIGFETGKYLYTDYSINEINSLIRNHPTYKKLNRFGVILDKSATSIWGFYDGGYSRIPSKNKLIIDFRYKNNRELVFTTETLIENISNPSNNIIWITQNRIIPRSSILTIRDLDKALLLMLNLLSEEDDN